MTIPTWMAKVFEKPNLKWKYSMDIPINEGWPHISSQSFQPLSLQDPNNVRSQHNNSASSAISSVPSVYCD